MKLSSNGSRSNHPIKTRSPNCKPSNPPPNPVSVAAICQQDRQSLKPRELPRPTVVDMVVTPAATTGWVRAGKQPKQ